MATQKVMVPGLNAGISGKRWIFPSLAGRAVPNRAAPSLPSSHVCWEGAKGWENEDSSSWIQGNLPERDQDLWGQARIWNIMIWTADTKVSPSSHFVYLIPLGFGWLLIEWLIPNYVIICIHKSQQSMSLPSVLHNGFY